MILSLKCYLELFQEKEKDLFLKKEDQQSDHRQLIKNICISIFMLNLQQR